MAENADVWYSSNSVVTGTDTGDAGDKIVSSVTPEGNLSTIFTAIGSGDDVVSTSDGLKFVGGRYLRWLPGNPVFEGALVLVDVTITARPVGTSAGLIVNLDNDINTRHYLRYTTTPLFQVLGPGNATFSDSKTNEFGERVTVAAYVDRTGALLGAGNGMAFIAPDGIINEKDLPATAQDIVLNSVQIGRSCDITIHSMAIFLKPVGGEYPSSLYALWRLHSGIDQPEYSDEVIQIVAIDGQSLSVGGDISSDERTEFGFVDRRGAHMLEGLERSDSATVFIAGPGALGYDKTVIPTGIVSAQPHPNKMTVAYPWGATVNLFRREMDVFQYKVLVGCNGIAGQTLDEFDDNLPVQTGSDSTTISESNDFWIEQSVAIANGRGITPTIPYFILVHGTADKSLSEGEYKTNLANYWQERQDMIAGHLPGSVPTLVMTQSGGDANTSQAGEDWNVCGDQLDFAKEQGAIFAGPLYPYEIDDNNVHPSGRQTALFSEVIAWAVATVEAGEKWNLGRPSAQLSGTQITLTFDLRSDEVLVTESFKYFGEGIDEHLGFEVDGTTIDSVTVSGSTVTINCVGVPTGYRYAMQAQNVTGFTDNLYTAHRGLLRTSKTHPSFMVEGATLYRWVPSLPTEPLS